jgi:hypothetical protein
MTLAVHAILNESMVPMLQSLSAILDKAIAYAEEKKIDARFCPMRGWRRTCSRSPARCRPLATH